MSVDDSVKYVCFIKHCVGRKFIPYVIEGGGIVVKTLREFLDHELLRWLDDPAVFRKIVRDNFIADVSRDTTNAKYASMLGWNYAKASRYIEEEGAVYVLTVHPRFESRAFSFRRARDDDDYALNVVRAIWSVRGGEIVFQVYDPEKHFPGCEFTK
jgi:hypothetical protein